MPRIITEVHMPNRPAKFVSAIFASVLAGAPLAIISGNAAHAADECLLAPKDQTPQGSHWYYRIDHASKRHCWYLRAEGDKLAQSTPQNPSPSTEPLAANAEAAKERSIANAHAELPRQTSIDPPSRNDAPVPAMPANTAASENENNGVAPSTAAPGSVVASRWLDPSGMSSAITPQPATSNVAANVPSDSAAKDTAAATPAAAAAVPPAAAAAAAADASQAPPASIAMLLGVMTGALALAGITASIVLKFGGARARRTAGSRVRRDRIWEPTDHDGIRLSAYPDADVVPRRTVLPRDLDEVGEPDDRVAEFFAQLLKQARG